MKVHIEIDCTPEEARTFMGLPDLTEANSVYVDGMTKAMKGVTSPDQLREYAQQLAPMGQMGLKLFQNFMESSIKAGSAATSSDKGSKAD